MAIISNRLYRNREPRLAHKRDHREYVYGNCEKCGAPYAIPEGTQWNHNNCWTCMYIALKGMTEADADRLHELLVTCDTDPAHIAITESVPNLAAWVKEAAAQMADYLDLKMTEANARY